MANTDNPNGFRFAYSEAGHGEFISGTLESGQTAYQGDLLVMDTTSGKLNVATATSRFIYGVCPADVDASSADTDIEFYPAVPWYVFDVQCSGTYAITKRGQAVDVETAGSGTFEANEDSYSNPLIKIIGEVDGTEIGANSRVLVKIVRSQYLGLNFSFIPEGAYTSAISTDATLTSADSGVWIMSVGSKGATITLPATGGVARHVFNIVNAAPSNTADLVINPNTNDMLWGMGAKGTDNKDYTNTKATAHQGDYMKLFSDGTSGYAILEVVGTWDKES
jgi:hypothetical protein